MDQAKDALMAELIDTAIQQHSVACEAKGKAPTERQLEWMRQHIPHFETCEKQARAAREG